MIRFKISASYCNNMYVDNFFAAVAYGAHLRLHNISMNKLNEL